jgi:hypothetical protein
VTTTGIDGTVAHIHAGRGRSADHYPHQGRRRGLVRASRLETDG